MCRKWCKDISGWHDLRIDVAAEEEYDHERLTEAGPLTDVEAKAELTLSFRMIMEYPHEKVSSSCHPVGTQKQRASFLVFSYPAESILPFCSFLKSEFQFVFQFSSLHCSPSAPNG